MPRECGKLQTNNPTTLINLQNEREQLFAESLRLARLRDTPNSTTDLDTIIETLRAIRRRVFEIEKEMELLSQS